MKLANFVKFALPSAVLALGLISTPAFASTSTGTMPVTANVPASCSISASTLAFGTISGPTVPINGISNVTYSCTSGTAVTAVSFTSAGSGGGPGFQMLGTTSPTNTLTYSLYLDSTRSTALKNGISPSPTPTLVTTGTPQTLPVYGQIALGDAQGAKADTYTDTVTITFTY